MSYARWLEPQLKLSLQHRRVVIISGPRQCGKTTLVKKLISKNVNYLTLDDPTLLEAAQNDPQTFVKRDNKLLIIDEVQRVPDLLLAIKKGVDENTVAGQYVLTGSTNIQQLPSVIESLAGRIRKLRLRTLAQGEINRKAPVFLENAFEQLFKRPEHKYDKDDVIDLALRGGFPEALKLESAQRVLWHKDYIEALLDHDLKEIINIRRKDSMQALLEALAAWSSKSIDLEAIGANLSVKRPTLESYVNALEALFLVERLPAWVKTDYGRVGRRAKLFFSDSGMMASILKWQHKLIRLEDEKVGKLIETFIYNELAANISCQTEYEMYHYRDREKREIDFIIERNDGMLLGIEVKAGSSIKRESFKHLKWFNENLVGQGRNFMGIILYTGHEVASFGKNLWVVPMACLW